MLKFVVRMLFPLLAVAGITLAGEPNAPVRLSSGVSQISLVELYTSEGCSSCPPADRWLSKLKSSNGLWTQFAPVAFHVDYWDYIGWRDEFSSPEFGDRQRRYAAEGGARFVYTPGVFRDGAEWHEWRRQKSVPANGKSVGELSLNIENDDISARFEPAVGSDRALKLHIAVLGMNLETRVAAGENKGKMLRHDFVALGHESVPMTRNGERYLANITLPQTRARFTRRAVVAWVSAADKQAPLQAVGGYLPDR